VGIVRAGAGGDKAASIDGIESDVGARDCMDRERVSEMVRGDAAGVPGVAVFRQMK
jgi:hypothetical protein